MQRFALRLLVNALAVLVASILFSSVIRVANTGGAFLFACVLGVLNAFLRPVLLLLTLPLTVLTLGLFTLVLNAVLFWIATLAPLGVQIDGFAGAFLGALTVTVLSFAASRALR
jgi:putative membrane protein